MSRVVKAQKGKVGDISFLIDNLEDMVRCQEDTTGTQAVIDGTKRAIIMDMCPAELDKHLIIRSNRFDLYPKVKTAIRNYAEQMRHKSGPTELSRRR